jgi:hypothetical protein
MYAVPRVAAQVLPFDEPQDDALNSLHRVEHDGVTRGGQRSTMSKYNRIERLAYNMIVADHVFAELQHDKSPALVAEVLTAHKIVQARTADSSLPECLTRFAP